MFTKTPGEKSDERKWTIPWICSMWEAHFNINILYISFHRTKDRTHNNLRYTPILLGQTGQCFINLAVAFWATSGCGSAPTNLADALHNSYSSTMWKILNTVRYPECTRSRRKITRMVRRDVRKGLIRCTAKLLFEKGGNVGATFWFPCKSWCFSVYSSHM